MRNAPLRVVTSCRVRPPGGIGEPGTAPIGPALANAIVCGDWRARQILALIEAWVFIVNREGLNMLKLLVNGQSHTVDVEPDTPLLLGCCAMKSKLTGTKFRLRCGCLRSMHGAHRRSSSSRLRAAVGSAAKLTITTIEGSAKDRSHALSALGSREACRKCGYCQSGMIWAAAALLQDKPAPRTPISIGDDELMPKCANL